MGCIRLYSGDKRKIAGRSANGLCTKEYFDPDMEHNIEKTLTQRTMYALQDVAAG